MNDNTQSRGCVERGVRDRRDRSKYTLEEALHEIGMAEMILDGCGATTGKTLWGRIASLKDKLSNGKLTDAGPETP